MAYLSLRFEWPAWVVYDNTYRQEADSLFSVVSYFPIYTGDMQATGWYRKHLEKNSRDANWKRITR